MSVVEHERRDEVMIVRMRRPEKRNAMNRRMLEDLASTWVEYENDPTTRIAVLTGSDESFCAGEDLLESVERGAPGFDDDRPIDPFWNQTLTKPVVAAVNGWAMGGGYVLAFLSDLRVASRNAVFEVSEAKRFLVGAYAFCFTEGLPWAVASELALGLRMDAERAHQLGFVNRLVDRPDQVVDAALELCDELLRLPPDSLTNTIEMCRLLKPTVSQELAEHGARLKQRGAVEDVMESRRAFVEGRRPRFSRARRP